MTTASAHTTGTVWRIEVAPGDHVDAGDTVVILESMKMETPVEAEEEGTVARVLVEEGQTVHEGEPVADLE
jgi:acetyl-CoA carboxylase biotin carboxyl carrier protein